MGENVSKLKLLLAVPTAIVVGVLNVFVFFLFMVLYGHVIDPGHEESYYQEAAGRFGPYASVIGGIPLMYLAGRWIGGKVGPQLAIISAILVWTVYFAVDLAIVAAAGALSMTVFPIMVVSFATKLGAVILGAFNSRKS